MKLPGRDTTRAEAAAVSAEIAALQADVERADATSAVRMRSLSLLLGSPSWLFKSRSRMRVDRKC